MKKIIIGIATMQSRKNSLDKVIECLQNQSIKPNEIYIYNNDENDFNATDNGKFHYFEKELKEDVYYFSIDDDILYPKTYIEDTIKEIEKHKCIITYHGRKLNGKDRNYYSGHQMCGCMQECKYDGEIDICGTGVTSFDTSYFKPVGIFKSEYKRMSDCIVSLEAHRQHKKIMLIKHKLGYFKDICDDVINSCFSVERNNCEKQIQICNEIIDLKNNKEPLVSIIIPFKIDRGYLDEAIKSIENQTYKNIEIIYSQSDNNVSYNFNRGLERSNGKYVKFLCDDDMLTENCIEDSVKFMEENDIEFLHGNAINFWVDGNQKVHRPNIKNPTLNEMKKLNQIHGGTLFYNKNIFDKYGIWDERLWCAEEYDFSLRLLYYGAKVGYLDKTLYLYRRHKEQKSLGNTSAEYQNKRKEAIDLIKKKY